MGYVDPKSARYNEVSAAEREKLWQEVHWLYKKLDDIVGSLLAHASEKTYVVLSSDHGAVPLNHNVRLNNLFAREGLVKFATDPKTGERTIDWPQTKAIYLNMHNVYVNPQGLGGNWKRGSGPEYEQLRQKVKDLLLGLQDAQGVKPVEKVSEWERASEQFKLLAERSGDLIVANRAGYGWTEETTEDLQIFSVPLISGYKQAIVSENTKGLWTPFIMVGPGIRKGHFLGESPIDMVDQYPTLLRCLGLEKPAWVQGKQVEAAFSRR
jgi:predicted AlkP superfamily phosphohydrolase/phosphomutase